MEKIVNQAFWTKYAFSTFSFPITQWRCLTFVDSGAEIFLVCFFSQCDMRTFVYEGGYAVRQHWGQAIIFKPFKQNDDCLHILTMLSVENFLHITRSVKIYLNPVFQFSCPVFMFLKTRFNLTCLFGVNGALDVCLL